MPSHGSHCGSGATLGKVTLVHCHEGVPNEGTHGSISFLCNRLCWPRRVHRVSPYIHSAYHYNTRLTCHQRANSLADSGPNSPTAPPAAAATVMAAPKLSPAPTPTQTVAPTLTPTPPPPFIAVSAGAGFTCGLRADGVVTCLVNNDRGQTSPPKGEGFTTISSGSVHTWALRPDGVVVCWGTTTTINCHLRVMDASCPSASIPYILVVSVKAVPSPAGVTTNTAKSRLRGKVASQLSPEALVIRVASVRTASSYAGVMTPTARPHHR